MAMAASPFKVGEINEVVLVGGQTRMPAIQKAVQDFFHPDRIVIGCESERARSVMSGMAGCLSWLRTLTSCSSNSSSGTSLSARRLPLSGQDGEKARADHK